jgi:hypothetical protein
MYENGSRDRARRAPRALGAVADEHDARAKARRALQDAYDWRDDEDLGASLVGAAAASAGRAASFGSGQPSAAEPGSRERSASARAAERRSRRLFVRSISRTVGV